MRMEGILEALPEAQDAGDADVVPLPFLPTELLDVIARDLIDSQDLRTCAMLNLTCRDIHYGTLPTLWRTLVCRTELGAGPFVDTEAWQEMVSRKGFQHVRFFVLESHGGTAFAVMNAFQAFESHERLEIMQHVRAVIVTDSTSWPHTANLALTNGPGTKIKDGRFSGIRLKDEYTYGSSDLYHLLYALGQGQHLVLHVFPSAGSNSGSTIHDSNSHTPSFPFKAAQLGPVAHIGCMTVNMYHEPEDVNEYRQMTPQAMSEMFALVAYSRGLFDVDAVRADEEEFYEATTVDVIGLDGEMAFMCMQAFAEALRVAPSLATISLQLQMDLSAPSTALTRRVLSPLKHVYAAAMTSVGRVKAGTVKVSLVSGQEQVSLGLHPDADDTNRGAEKANLAVAVTYYDGTVLKVGELESWLNGDVGRVNLEEDVGSLISEHEFPLVRGLEAEYY
ncbi:hypothetical protein QFC21_006354 [Naganishia friedmannii]|uniref:Uncharacterized protein n=1 Tax=Naganishia friedmannii TaxID=89922 RepID=A0ACC2V4F3_9TREE|nr:hypothetical protein QFC21_006354 [Naganishia friedmannii]